MSESRLPETPADTGFHRPSRSTISAVYIARCPEHGLHGERTHCYECGAEAEQVAMVPAVAADRLQAALEQLDGHVGYRQQAIITQTLRPPAPADQQGAG